MFSIRQKLMLGFGGLLTIVAVIGVVTIVQIRHLGEAIEVILRENYRSVVACQQIKESLERVDRGIVFTFLGADANGRRQIEAGMKKFSQALTVEMGNITLPGEGEKSHRLGEVFHEYSEFVPKVTDPSRPLEERRADYFSMLLPLFEQIKGLTGDPGNEPDQHERGQRYRPFPGRLRATPYDDCHSFLRRRGHPVQPPCPALDSGPHSSVDRVRERGPPRQP